MQESARPTVVYSSAPRWKLFVPVIFMTQTSQATNKSMPLLWQSLPARPESSYKSHLFQNWLTIVVNVFYRWGDINMSSCRCRAQ